jgi:hypothetical protein
LIKYILDLHGNKARKKKFAPMVHLTKMFLIMQGVSINLFIKTGRKENDRKVFI